MKKNRKKAIILSVLILAAAVIAVAAVILFIRYMNKSTYIQQQNYVASKLLELGDYKEGRQLAAQSELSSPNETSEALLVLAIAFQEDYDTALRYLSLFEDDAADSVLTEIQEKILVYHEAVEALSVSDEEENNVGNGTNAEDLEVLENNLHSDLLIILLQVQNGIFVKKDSVAVQSMISMLSSDRYDFDQTSSDNSLLSKKVQTLSALESGDYGDALDLAQDLLAADSSFENRALVANIAAAAGATDSELLSENSQLQSLLEERSELIEQLSELQTQFEEATKESKQQSIQNQIDKKQEQIEEIEEEIYATPAKQAINYIETTTPVMQRNTISYQLELSQLYYQAGEEEEAQDILLKVLDEDHGENEIIDILVDDLLDAYQESGESGDTLQAWEIIAELLHFMESNSRSYNSYGSGDDETFYDFVMDLLDQKFNGLIIREIDATAFPRVRVTVNIALNLDETLTEKNFTILDMAVEVSDFTLLDQEVLQSQEELSVVLVVDHSGSMDGSTMENTKSAVSSFIKDMDGSAKMGLVIFSGSAEVVNSLGSTTNELLKGISSVSAGGGTSIYLGLETAGDELMNESGRKVIILLSDGQDGSSGMIDEVLVTLNNRNIYVYTIGFGGADTEYLSYIATQCGGKFIEAASSDLLTEIYASIGQYIQNDYIFEFTAETELEDYSRFLRVEADITDAYAEKKYNVGVPLEDILSEDGQTPLADYFKEIGGSWMGDDKETPDISDAE